MKLLLSLFLTTTAFAQPVLPLSITPTNNWSVVAAANFIWDLPPTNISFFNFWEVMPDGTCTNVAQVLASAGRAAVPLYQYGPNQIIATSVDLAGLESETGYGFTVNGQWTPVTNIVTISSPFWYSDGSNWVQTNSSISFTNPPGHRLFKGQNLSIQRNTQ